MDTELKRQFDSHGPWRTGFEFNGDMYGGDDPRGTNEWDFPGKFFSAFPDCSTLLELGSFEGGHTLKFGEKCEVTAIEGREYNLRKAQFAKSVICPDADITFMCEDVEKFDITSLGKFDAVSCVGVLYHVMEPWKLLDSLSQVTNNLFLGTHYCEGQSVSVSRSGYRGKMYKEGGWNDSLSGLSAQSFWPTVESLYKMLNDSGFNYVLDVTNLHTPAMRKRAGDVKYLTIVAKKVA